MRIGSWVLLGAISIAGSAALLERQKLNQLRDLGFQWEAINRGLFDREMTGVTFAPVPSASVESVSLSILKPSDIFLDGVTVDIEPYLGLITTPDSSAERDRTQPNLMEHLPLNANVMISNGRVRWGDRPLAEAVQGRASAGEVELNWPEGTLSLSGEEFELSADHFVESEYSGFSVEALATVYILGSLGSTSAMTATLRELVVRGELLSLYPVALSDIQIELNRDRVARVVTQQGGSIILSLGTDLSSLTLEDVSVSELLSMMESALPEIDDADISGSISGAISLPEGLPTFEVDSLSVSGAVDHVAALRRGYFTHRVPTEGGGVGIRGSGEGAEGWTPLDEISPYMAWAVVAAEDSNFWSHSGYDPSSISEALIANAAAGSVVRGGSTLTQQLAKNLFLSGEQTLIRKIRELIIAVELDRALGKERIMELYLNIVEWGPEIYGVTEAAEAYFMKRPSQLTAKEAAFLAAILPSPRRFYRDWYLQDRAGEYRVSWVLENMANAGNISREAARELENGRLLFVPPPVQ